MKTVMRLKGSCDLSFSDIFDILKEVCKKLTIGRMMSVIYEEHDYRNITGCDPLDSFVFAMHNKDNVANKVILAKYAEIFKEDKVEALNAFNVGEMKFYSWFFKEADTSFRMIGRRLVNNSRIIEVISRNQGYYDALCSFDWIYEELPSDLYSVFANDVSPYEENYNLSEINLGRNFIGDNQGIKFDVTCGIPIIKQEELLNVEKGILDNFTKGNRLSLILSSEKVSNICKNIDEYSTADYENCNDPNKWFEATMKAGDRLIDDMVWEDIVLEKIGDTNKTTNSVKHESEITQKTAAEETAEAKNQSNKHKNKTKISSALKGILLNFR